MQRWLVLVLKMEKHLPLRGTNRLDFHNSGGGVAFASKEKPKISWRMSQERHWQLRKQVQSWFSCFHWYASTIYDQNGGSS